MPDDRHLDDRKSAILRAVVQQYIETAQPVGSTTVASRSEVAVSSATVRNEMTVLEREGYLAQPHTSAGRVPTEKGYRFFVDGLAGTDLSPTNVRAVRDFFSSAHGELESMLRETTRLLSTLTHSAAVVVGDPPEVATIRSVQLVDLNPRTVLVVVVLSDGVVLKRTFDPGPTTAGGSAEADLADGQALVSRSLVGSRVTDLDTWAPPVGAPGAAVAAAAADAVRIAAVTAADQQVYVDGAAHVAGSFETRETVEQVLTILEQHFVVVSLLKELVDGGLTVAIGSETGVDTLADCALVVAPFTAGDSQAGAIAVIGPTRMDYAETVSTVSVVSRRLSRMLTDGRPAEG